MLYNDRAAFILQQLQLKSTVKVTEIAKRPSVISAGVKSSILKKNAGRRLKLWNICARAA